MANDIRPECIQEATEAEHGNDHESRELREHSSQRQDHEVVFQSDEHKPEQYQQGFQSGMTEGLPREKQDRNQCKKVDTQIAETQVCARVNTLPKKNCT